VQIGDRKQPLLGPDQCADRIGHKLDIGHPDAAVRLRSARALMR
jgi:hypothetical protein